MLGQNLLRQSAMIVAAAVALIGCAEGIQQDGAWFDYEAPVSFDAQDEALHQRFRVDVDGLGWVLDGIAAEAVEFDRVAFMFDAKGSPELDVRVSSDDGTTWSEWFPVVITWSEGELHNAHADLPHGGTQIQVRLRDLQPEEISFLSLEGFAVEFEEDEGGSDEAYEDLGGLGTQTQALAANRGVDVSRAGWSARTARCSSRHTINRITVHHTVTPNNDRSTMPARMRQIQSYHMDSRGYCDIGYHFLVGQDGRVYQGRAETFSGAHVLNANSGNGGVSYIGTYSDVVPSNAMMNAGARILRAIGCQYGIAMNRTKVKGHRELGSTACPGAALYGRLANLVSMAANISCSGGTTSPPPAPDPAPAPSPSPSPSPGTGTGSATVQGVVHAAGNTNQRISGATVVVGGQRATTNSNGYYSVRVSAGTHTITASASGYQTGSLRRTVPVGSQTWGSLGLRRQTTSTSPSSPTTQGKLVGVVYEAPNSTRRLSGATVRLSNGASATTGADGFFSFNVPAGTYTVTVSRSGFQTGSVSRRVGSGTVWGSVGLRRQEARGTLTGVVYENPNTNRRISGASVTLSNGQTTTSSSTGSFSFSVAPGSYRITASRFGYGSATIVRSVQSGAQTQASVGLSKVTSSSGSLIGVIYVRPDTSERVPGARVWTSSGQSTTANSNGVYTLSGVPAGPVSIYAGATGYSSGAVDRTVRAGEQVWGSIGLGRPQGSSGGGGGVEGEGSGESTNFEGVLKLVSPVNEEVTGADPEFEWENLTSAQAGTASFRYRVVVISYDGEETHEAVVAGAVGGTSKSSIGLSLEPGKWLWVVFAIRDHDGHLLAGSVLDDEEAGVEALFEVR